MKDKDKDNKKKDTEKQTEEKLSKIESLENFEI